MVTQESGWNETVLFDIDHFRGFTEGDADLERDVLTIFLDNAPQYLATLATSSPGEWRVSAHKLKGAARSIGAWNLAREAERAEHRNALAQDDPVRAEIVNELQIRLQRLSEYLQKDFLPALDESTA